MSKAARLTELTLSHLDLVGLRVAREVVLAADHGARVEVVSRCKLVLAAIACSNGTAGLGEQFLNIFVGVVVPALQVNQGILDVACLVISGGETGICSVVNCAGHEGPATEGLFLFFGAIQIVVGSILLLSGLVPAR